MRVVFLLKLRFVIVVDTFVLRASNKKALVEGDFDDGTAPSGRQWVKKKELVPLRSVSGKSSI